LRKSVSSTSLFNANRFVHVLQRMVHHIGSMLYKKCSFLPWKKEKFLPSARSLIVQTYILQRQAATGDNQSAAPNAA
jgi:hypothetical protein